MARLGVTYQDIANAADQIRGQGRQPTIELIRQLLGTGSTTTIANHLRQWRAEQDDSTSVAIKENLPQELVSLMKGLWQRLQSHADNQITEVKQASEQTIQLLRQEVEKYKTNNQRWQQLFNQWRQEKETLSLEKRSLEEAILSRQQEIAVFHTTCLAQQDQLQEKQERMTELHRLHRQAQENLEHYRDSMRVQRLIDQEQHAKELQQTESLLKVAEQQWVHTNQDKILLQQQIEKTNSEHFALQQSHASLEKEYDEAKRNRSHLQKQLEASQHQGDQQSVLLREQQHQNVALNQQLLLLREAVTELKDQNKLLAHEKWEMAQEKAHLEGRHQQMQHILYAK